ncbi:hypothetical protein GCM10010978_04710 [Compostibacillus humi]|uniref:Peptidylprolyl isomerase n=1 Tax=Compostibacillus humi TaxID=1245525 RepID=A0A8J3EJA9_9BACI|nr:hypothetical protein [Compostibacillus humi]GGH70117.1 hypothetical protein GCM10010978_04710 [Compostibacillus humi]
MKKLLSLLLLSALMITACNDAALSISELEIVPDEVLENITPDDTLQMINEGDDIAYIVYFSSGTVTPRLETEGEMLIIQLEVTGQEEDDEEKPYVYKLTLDPELEMIDILINGKSVPFDRVTAL